MRRPAPILAAVALAGASLGGCASQPPENAAEAADPYADDQNVAMPCGPDENVAADVALANVSTPGGC